MKIASKIFSIFAGVVYIGFTVIISLVLSLSLYNYTCRWGDGIYFEEYKTLYYLNRVLIILSAISFVVLSILYLVFLIKKRKRRQLWKDIMIIVWAIIGYILFYIIPPMTYRMSAYVLYIIAPRIPGLPCNLLEPNILTYILMSIPSRFGLAVGSALLIIASVWNMVVEIQWKNGKKKHPVSRV